MEKLTDREVDVMMAIWNSTYDPVPTGDILRHIKRSKRNSLQTLQVVLRRLCEKDVVICEKGRQTNLYTALITEADYLKSAEANFISHHFHGSPGALMRFLYQNNMLTLTNADKKELLKIAAEMEREAEDAGD